MHDHHELIDLDRLEASLPELTERYRSAQPYPHIVLDDVVTPGALAAAYSEFDAVDDETWRGDLHVNERKYANTDPSTWGAALAGLAEAFWSERFVAFLSTLTGFDDLEADRGLDGGGLHRSLSGGYLNVHSDFTAHHLREGWRRRVNLLLYLNPRWDPEWGGDLELWATDMSHCVERVTPVGNRMLLFTTEDDSYHGHPDPLSCPPDVARQSLALTTSPTRSIPSCARRTTGPGRATASKPRRSTSTSRSCTPTTCSGAACGSPTSPPAAG